MAEVHTAAARALAQFGEFELDLQQGCLRRGGVPVALQEKPLLLLLVLVERPGEIVTREALCARLWPVDTFVGFEDGLNTAVRKLRQALDDSSDRPRFIETVPKRGYRFIAAVTRSSPPLPPSTRPAPPARRWRAFAFACVLAATSALVAVTVRSRTGSPPLSSIAVLPLELLSGDRDQEYFADGMTDAITTDLARITSLHVISRTSAMHFRATRLTARQIADQLGVDAIVEGSIVRSGTHVHVSAQLIDARRDRHLWAESYDGEMRDILTLQSRVAESVAAHVEAKLTPAAVRGRRSRSVDPAAYEEYLQGRYHWAKYTGPGWRKAIEHFRSAIDRDSSYAPSHLGLGESYILLAGFSYLSPRNAIPSGIAALGRAMSLDPDDAEAHYALGFEKTNCEYDWSGAEGEFRTALRLDPNNAIGRMWYALLLSALGRHDEAIAEQLQARALDPVSLIVNTNLCRTYVFARRSADAVAACRHALELDPHFQLAYMWLAMAHRLNHEPDLAFRADQQRLVELGVDPRIVERNESRHRPGGDRAFDRGELDAALERYRTTGIGALDVSEMFARAGELDTAFDYLNKAYDAREPPVCLLAVHPRWDPLRSDPRFTALLKRLHLNPES